VKKVGVYLILLFIFIGCGGSNSGSESVDSVNLVAKVEVPISLDVETKSLKRLSSTDISGIYLTVFDSQKNYYQDKKFIFSENSWELNLTNLPIGRDIRFIVEALNYQNQVVMEGSLLKELTVDTSSVSIPLTFSYDEPTINLPTIYSGQSNDNDDGSANLTFTIINPNSDKVTWRVTPDPILPENIIFEPIDGALSSDGKSIEGEIDFSTIVGDSIEISIAVSGDLGNLAYRNNSFELTNSYNDITTLAFSIYSPRDEIYLSIAPILENIFITFREDEIEAKAVIFADFPQFSSSSSGCSNNFEELNSFRFSDQTFETLFRHYYDAIYDGVFTYEEFGVENSIDVNSTLYELRRMGNEFNASLESNFSRLMKIDINDSWESLFGELQNIYYADARFDSMKNYLYGDGFQSMLDYYVGEKSLVVALESFYGDRMRDEYNASLIDIITGYKKSISNFSDFLEFMINPPSTMLTDFSVEDMNFSQNGEYYYSKFGADSNRTKDELHGFLKAIEDFDFQEFEKLFNQSGIRLYILMQLYYNVYNIYDSRFSKLLEMRVDETEESLIADLNNRFADEQNSTYENFTILYENRDFLEFLEYYKTYEDLDPKLVYSIQSKYDETICAERLESDDVEYSWKFASDPERLIPCEETTTPCIFRGDENPLLITDFYGNLNDTLILDVTNGEGAKAQYSVDINVKNYHDSTGKPLVIETVGSGVDDNESNDTATDTNTTTVSDGDPAYQFDLRIQNDESAITLVYGQQETVRFIASKEFDFQSELIGKINFLNYTVTKIADTVYDVSFTAKDESGEEPYDFILQNGGHTEVERVTVTVVPPVVDVKIDEVIADGSESTIVSVFENQQRTVLVEATSPIGSGLRFSIGGVDADNFFVTKKESVISSGTAEGIVNELTVWSRSSAGSTNTITLTITDEVIGKSSTFKILLKSAEYVAPDDDNKFVCNHGGDELTLNSNLYEYLSVKVGEGSKLSVEGLFEIESSNIIDYYSNDLYNIEVSKLVVLHKPSNEVTRDMIGAMDIYNSNTHEIIGRVKYSQDALGTDFYLKYFDQRHFTETGEVMCEKFSFPEEI
jgi:hypothetical protein